MLRLKTRPTMLALTAFATMSAGFAKAIPIAYEGFDYDAGTNASSVYDGGTGWTSEWTGNNQGNFVSVDSPVLSYTDGNGVTLPASGNAAYIQRNVRTYPRTFAQQGVVTPGSSQTYWFSVILKPNYTPDEDLTDLGLELLIENGTSDRLRFGDPAGGTTYGMSGLQGSAYSTVEAETTVNGEYPSQFLVIKYVVGETNSDGSVFLFMNPDLGAANEPAEIDADASITGTNSTAMSFDTLTIVVPTSGVPTGRSKGYYDEIRIGTEYKDVAPIPEPATLGLLGLAGMALTRRRRA